MMSPKVSLATASLAMQIRDLSSAEFSRLSAMLDEVLEVNPSLREDWLARLDTSDPEWGALLRQFLVNQAPEGWLATQDVLERQMASLDHDEPELTGKRFGPYRAVSLLGHGGMGSVWLAERADGLFTRQVALKLIHPALLGRGATERFAREREILAALEHPNIARLLDAGMTEDGQPFLALQYVKGTAITAYCDERCLSIRERLELLLQVLSAVQYAHAHLVIHRDLKPSNILVTDDGVAQLLDFGIAKLLTGGAAQESELTQLGGRALTLEYASPEQIAGAPLTVAADIYSLGVILCELLAGERPYRPKRNSRGALEEAILTMEAVPPSRMVEHLDVAERRSSTPRSLRKTLRGDLDVIALKALNKIPEYRYGSAEAFLEDLKRYLDGDAVLARPDSRWYRLRKAVRRNRVAVVTVGLVLASLTVGLSVAIVKEREAVLQRTRAESVRDFIASIFDSASPYVGGRPKLLARDILDIGASRVQRELPGDPEVAAELLALLSSSYMDLGELDAALAAARRAQKLTERLPVRADPLRARVFQVLARAEYGKGNTQEADDLLRRAISIERSAGTRYIPDLARSLGLLSNVVLDQNGIDESVSLQREAVQLMLLKRGELDPLTIQLMGELSNRLLFTTHAAESLQYAQRAYRAALQNFGDPNHPAVILQLNHVAYALDATRQFKEAAEQWQRILEADTRIFSPGSFQISTALYGLARANERLGKLKEALRLYGNSLEMLQRNSITSGGELATHYFAVGRVAVATRQGNLAVSSLSPAVSLGVKAMGPDAERVHDGENFLAAAHLYAGNLEQAQELLGRRITEARGLHEGSLPTLLMYWSLLQHARGDEQAALSAAMEAWESNAAKTPQAQAPLLANLGRAQLEMHELQAASETLGRAVSLMSQAEPAVTPRQADTWLALGRVDLEQHRITEALKWISAATQFWEQFDPQNPFCGEAELWYARALRAQGNLAQARERQTRSIPLLNAAPWTVLRNLTGPT